MYQVFNQMKKLTNAVRRTNAGYLRRKNRTNTTIKSNSDLPRLVVSRSNKHMSAQVINDGITVLGIADIKITIGTKTEKAYELGTQLGKKLIEKGISNVVFDRNGYLYHGRVKSMCEWVRSTWVTI